MGSIGRAVPGVEVRIVDESGSELPVDEPGEIITSGPHVMKGYFRKAEATSARIRNGWFYTGDVGKRDSDGYFIFPNVQETIVFAIPDPKRGEVIGAAVVPRPDHAIATKELISFLRANLANFKVPQKIVIRESLPRTSSGKVIRDSETLLSDGGASPSVLVWRK